MAVYDRHAYKNSEAVSAYPHVWKASALSDVLSYSAPC